MSFSIVDKKTGELMQGGFSTENEALDALIDSGATDEEIANEYDVIVDSENTSRTSYEDRKKNFRRLDERVLSEVFPNISEQVMKGNTEFSFNLGKDSGRKNWDLAKAGLSDVFSLPGRAVSAYLSTQPQPGGRGKFDLGRRSGEGTSLAGTIARDPITGMTITGTPLLARGIQGGARLGKLLIGGQGFARGVGGAAAGAIEGAAIEGMSAELNDREPDYALGTVAGGVFEGLGQAAQALLQRYGKNLVRSSAQALRLGNTDRPLTDSELAQFLSNERNVDALEKVLDASSRGRNMTPFVNDRGKSLEGALQTSREEAVSTIKNEPALNSGFDKGIDVSNPSSADMQRRMNALNTPDKEIEMYTNKTPYKEGQRNIEDSMYGYEEPARKFISRNPYKKDYKYQSNAEFNMEKFGDKWDSLYDRFSKEVRVNKKPMTEEEKAFIEVLKKEAESDKNVLKGYNPEYVVNSNKFLGDRMPFGKKKIEKALGEFIEKNLKNGFSKEFLDEGLKITGEAYGYGRDMFESVQEAIKYTGKDKAVLERALAYSKTDPYAVKKGYKDAIDNFADKLSDYADGRIGKTGSNAKGEEYVVSKDKMKKYVYSYLAKVQESLEKNGAIDADLITSLYGLATNVNDETVKDAVLTLLKDLKVPKETIKRFEDVGGSYAMLNKARTRMKRNANEDNPFKGTIAAPIYPQEGFNAANAIGYRLQKRNFDLGKNAMTPFDNPTTGGKAMRSVFYLGKSPYRGEESKDK